MAALNFSWVLLGGCLAHLLYGGARCETWFARCVDFRWVLLGSLAALICRWVLLGSAMISVGRFLAAVRHCCFALATVARVGLPVALIFVGSSWFVGCVLFGAFALRWRPLLDFGLQVALIVTWFFLVSWLR